MPTYPPTSGQKSRTKVRLPWERGCSECHSVIVTTRLDSGQSLREAMLNTLKTKRQVHSAMLVYIFLSAAAAIFLGILDFYREF